jgi:hypothetical protein
LVRLDSGSNDKIKADILQLLTTGVNVELYSPISCSCSVALLTDLFRSNTLVMFLSLVIFITQTHTHPVSLYCLTSRQIVFLIGDTNTKLSTMFTLHIETIIVAKFDDNDVLLLLLFFCLFFFFAAAASVLYLDLTHCLIKREYCKNNCIFEIALSPSSTGTEMREAYTVCLIRQSYNLLNNLPVNG